MYRDWSYMDRTRKTNGLPKYVMNFKTLDNWLKNSNKN